MGVFCKHENYSFIFQLHEEILRQISKHCHGVNLLLQKLLKVLKKAYR